MLSAHSSSASQGSCRQWPSPFQPPAGRSTSVSWTAGWVWVVQSRPLTSPPRAPPGDRREQHHVASGTFGTTWFRPRPGLLPHSSPPASLTSRPTHSRPESKLEGPASRPCLPQAHLLFWMRVLLIKWRHKHAPETQRHRGAESAWKGGDTGPVEAASAVGKGSHRRLTGPGLGVPDPEGAESRDRCAILASDVNPGVITFRNMWMCFEGLPHPGPVSVITNEPAQCFC